MHVKSTDLQNAFGKYLALVEKEEIIITKNGKNVAKLISYTQPDFVLVREGSNAYKLSKRVSYEEYLDLVNSSDQRYELIDGEVYLLASPSFAHQLILNEIAWHFTNYFKGKPCRTLTAPFDVHLYGYATKFEEDPNVVQPDIIVICDLDKVTEDKKYEGIPSLLVEVLSPSTKDKDLTIKTNLYKKSGISEYWIVDIEAKQIAQYSFADKEVQTMQIYQIGDTIESATFAGLSIALAEIFTDI